MCGTSVKKIVGVIKKLWDSYKVKGYRLVALKEEMKNTKE